MDEDQTTDSHAQAGDLGVGEASSSLSTEVSNAWDTIDRMVDGFFTLLPKLAIASGVLVLFVGSAWLIKLIVLRSTRHHASQHIGRVLARLTQWAIYIVGVMVAVAIVAPSVTPAKLLGALGVGSVAIGFAFKDILQNFLAGILILLRQPFKAGDAVRFGEHEGVVQEVDTRLTIIRTYDGKQVLVPNGEIYTNPITVLTAYDERRQQYDVGIGYQDDIGAACRTIDSVMRSTEGVLADPPPDILVNELGASSVNLRARWWSRTTDVLAVKSRVVRAIKEALDDSGIDIPYPTQVTFFHDRTSADGSSPSREGEIERSNGRSESHRP